MLQVILRLGFVFKIHFKRQKKKTVLLRHVLSPCYVAKRVKSDALPARFCHFGTFCQYVVTKRAERFTGCTFCHPFARSAVAGLLSSFSVCVRVCVCVCVRARACACVRVRARLLISSYGTVCSFVKCCETNKQNVRISINQDICCEDEPNALAKSPVLHKTPVAISANSSLQ